MQFEKDKQSKLLERAKQLLEKADATKKQKNQSNRIEPFLKGEVHLLEENDFIDELVTFIKTNSNEKAEITKLLIKCLENDDVEIRHRALTMLCLYWESKSFAPEIADLKSFVQSVTAWYEMENDYFPGLPKLNKSIVNFLKSLLGGNEFETVEELLSVLSRIQSGVLFKSSNIKNEVKLVIGELNKKDVLERLLLEYEVNEEERRSLASILVYLGSKASSYLLHKMIQSPNDSQKERLTNLLACFGGSVIPVLSNCLKKNPPWFVVRNVLKIYGEMEDSSLYNDIKSYASYKDIRVQQEVLKSVLRMQGPRLAARLFEMLPLVDPQLQINIVYQLKEEDTPEVIEQLSDYLESSLHILLRREEVLIALVSTIQQYPSERTLFLLRILEEECTLRPRLERLKDVVHDALSVTEPILRHQKRKKVDDKAVSFTNDPHEHKRALQIVRKIRSDVEQKSREDEQNEIVDLMYEEGIKLVEEREFVAANMVLEQMMTLSPDFIEKVVKLEELIEKGQDHRWTRFQILTASLNPFFSDAEMKVLVSAMSIEDYMVGEYVVKAGETDFCLYFILSGFLQIQWEQDGRNVFLKRLSRGESFGNDHFLDASHWTINILSIAPATLAVLSVNSFKNLVKRHPQLESKMKEFCKAGTSIPDLLKMSGEERRRFPRYPTHAVVQIVVLDIYGKKVSRTLKGALFDVSESGIALVVRFANDSLVQSFLGRTVFSEIYSQGEVVIQCRGRVVGARVVDEEEQRFSLHLHLSEQLSKDDLKILLS